MEGVYDIYNLPVGERKTIGNATLSTFEFSANADQIGHFRMLRDGVGLSDGKYVRLHVDGHLFMSDTEMEKRSNSAFCHYANGHVLIAGLGIGLIIKNIIPKINDGTISKVTIIEKSKDVIELIQPYFNAPCIEIIHADIFEYVPPKGVKYDTVYFDIWADICTDTLEEIKLLHNRYKFKLNRDNPKKWMNSWMKEKLQNDKKRENRYSYY